MSVVPIRKADPTQRKGVAATQKAIDTLPLNSGTWRVEGIPGLYLRCRAKSKSFFLQRRIAGELVKKTLGELSMKAAKAVSLKTWNNLRPKSAPDGAPFLETAIEQYLDAKALAEKTRKLARYNTARYLAQWKDRSLAEIGRDRAGVRLLQQRITREHGPSTSNQVVRLLSAVYRWHRKVNTDLPESPMVAAEVHNIPARDWAYSDDELRTWWAHSAKQGEKVVQKGVSTLSTVKKAWWLATLLTGARKGSIEALRWADLDLEKRTIKFRVTKGDRPYDVPMSDPLAAILTRYRKNSDVPPSEWLFPSSVIDGGHLTGVKNPVEGVGPAHRLRHTFRTALAALGATPDQARLLMGHSLGGDVSGGYITSSLLIESLRPITNAVAARYVEVLGGALE